jgi:hypothetical protein
MRGMNVDTNSIYVESCAGSDRVVYALAAARAGYMVFLPPIAIGLAIRRRRANYSWDSVLLGRLLCMVDD